MALQPCSLVGGDGEGVRVGLGEHVAPIDLGEDPLRHILRNAVALSPFQEPLPVPGDKVVAVRPGEGPPHLIGLRSREPRHVHDELHHLLLPHDDAVAPLQSPFLQRMVVFPGNAVPVPLHEPGHGAALDADAGPDEGHLVGQVQERTGTEALPHLELGGRL